MNNFITPINKFNGGLGATLCNNCGGMINPKGGHEDKHKLFCDECKSKTKFVISKNRYRLKIKTIEKKYGVKYIGDFDVLQKSGSYSIEPVSIFYQPNSDINKGHSNYLGIYVDRIYSKDKQDLITTGIYMTNGLNAFKEPLIGLFIKKKNKVLISCYNYNYVTDGDYMIDGGRQYNRYSLGGNGQLVHVIIDKDKLKIKE